MTERRVLAMTDSSKNRDHCNGFFLTLIRLRGCKQALPFAVPINHQTFFRREAYLISSWLRHAKTCLRAYAHFTVRYQNHWDLWKVSMSKCPHENLRMRGMNVILCILVTASLCSFYLLRSYVMVYVFCTYSQTPFRFARPKYV